MIANSCYLIQDICSCVCLCEYTISVHELYVCMHATTVKNLSRWDIAALREFFQQYLDNSITSSVKKLVPRDYNIIWISAYMHKVNQYLLLKTPCHCLWLTWWCKNYWRLINQRLSISCMQSTCYQWNHHHFKIDSLPLLILNGGKREQATN